MLSAGMIWASVTTALKTQPSLMRLGAEYRVLLRPTHFTGHCRQLTSKTVKSASLWRSKPEQLCKGLSNEARRVTYKTDAHWQNPMRRQVFCPVPPAPAFTHSQSLGASGRAWACTFFCPGQVRYELFPVADPYPDLQSEVWAPHSSNFLFSSQEENKLLTQHIQEWNSQWNGMIQI